MVRSKITLFSYIQLVVGLSACGSGDVDRRTISRETELPPSFNCNQGELRTQTGIDVNQNGLLEPAEITSDIVSCNINNGLGGNDRLFHDE